MARYRLEWEWETLDDNSCRAKVIGGWLVRHWSNDGRRITSDTMVFVADRDHEWSILTPKADPIVERSAIAKDFEPSA